MSTLAIFVWVFGLVVIIGLTWWASDRHPDRFWPVLLLGIFASILLGQLVSRL